MKKSIALLPVTAGILAGMPLKFDITNYEILNPKIENPVKFVVLADVHDTKYGKDMKKLIDKINEINPDFIVFPGDLCQETTENKNSFLLIEGLKKYPLLYCSGNHEERREDVSELKEVLRDKGVIVLDKTAMPMEVNGTLLEIGGLSSRKRWQIQYSADDVNRMYHTDGYRILLSHKPHWLDLYTGLDVDLTVCGHAHGGQWRIPGTHRGLGAPDQGFMPKFTEGIHRMNLRNYMLISRGVTWHYHGLPKLFNNPEITVVTLRSK